MNNLKDFTTTKNKRKTTPNTERNYNEIGDTITLRQLQETYIQTGRATVIHGKGNGKVSVSLQKGLE